MTLIFTDGISFNTSGPLRILTLPDGNYIIGNGVLIPTRSRKEAEDLIKQMTRSKK